MRRYDGRVIVITGAGQGLGRAMARRFVAEGASLALCDLNPGTVRETAAAWASSRAVASTVDVTDSGQVDRWVDETCATFGHVDALVNNAGIIRNNRIEHMTDDAWQAVVDVSLRGAFHCTRAVFGHMKQRGYGRILRLSSMCWRGNFGQANYSAAKAGIIGMTRTVALEGAARSVVLWVKDSMNR
jgi:3-oxoacyl-[acyl-carrier protein] reductase